MTTVRRKRAENAMNTHFKALIGVASRSGNEVATCVWPCDSNSTESASKASSVFSTATYFDISGCLACPLSPPYEHIAMGSLTLSVSRLSCVTRCSNIRSNKVENLKMLPFTLLETDGVDLSFDSHSLITFQGETSKLSQSGVSFGMEQEIGQGTLIITSHRIMIVVGEFAYALGLDQVEGVESVGLIRPKLKLTCKLASSDTLVKRGNDVWPCRICGSMARLDECSACKCNRHGEMQCFTCTFMNPLDSSAVNGQPLSCKMCGTRIPMWSRTQQQVCQRCTFLNGPDDKECSMCQNALLGLPTPIKHGSYEVKLTFNQGIKEAYSSIKSVISKQEWKTSLRALKGTPVPAKPIQTIQPTPKADTLRASMDSPLPRDARDVQEEKRPQSRNQAGLGQIMQSISISNTQTQQQLDESFRDLSTLMDRANDMVNLASSLVAKLNKETDSGSIAKVQDLLYDLGIGVDAPVTKEAVGSSLYFTKLSEQIHSFISPVLEQRGMMALTDLYVLYNRARGVHLVSPQDLYKAVSMWSNQVKVPARLRKFPSGTTVVEADSMNEDKLSQRVLQFVAKKEKEGVSAIQLALGMSCAPALAMEWLTMAEGRSLLCRDETIHGISFYPNLFLNPSLVQ